MFSCGRFALQVLLRQPAVRSFSRTPAQHTVIVERWWEVPLSKEGSPPRLYPRRHRVYKLVEDTKHAPKEKMKLILTQTVEKLGGRGDTVFVKKSIGRNKLLAQGLAVYPSPENKQMFAEELKLLREGQPDQRVQTRTGQMTVELLKRSNLKVIKTFSDDFQLTKEVVCRQFEKKLGIVVPPHVLSLPFEPIKELGEYWCDITVNGKDTVRVPLSLLPYEDQSAVHQKHRKLLMAEDDSQADAEEDDATLTTVSDAPEAEDGKDSTTTVQTQQGSTSPPTGN
ncbi:39S ribosomal protein L9, mitochondrial [Poeciliopsis prolifica]|uniref:39S ribosomal protein L9, mitochondrial n=1 Tax=Poeciliopsis prolifica TaxID=188132 RepID=UPI00072C7187|nr:39S ribosomal protein L9, mitochondrial [Poeciliopsis prolifica]